MFEKYKVQKEQRLRIGTESHDGDPATPTDTDREAGTEVIISVKL
jgi:hypothetical protein